MKKSHPVSLFPFLGVLISTMGVLSFLAVTFLLLINASVNDAESSQPIEVRWNGAPPHVKPVLVECLENELVVHFKLGSEYQVFSQDQLRKEIAAVRRLLTDANKRLGATASRYQQWLFIKTALQDSGELADSFALALHELELRNLNNSRAEQAVSRYPILLVYPKGIATYELASYLVESTTRLAVGLEPILDGWALPYQDLSL